MYQRSGPGVPGLPDAYSVMETLPSGDTVLRSSILAPFHTRYSNRVSRSENVARVPGFEPGAYRLGGGCSIQLSYTRVTSIPILARLEFPYELRSVRWRVIEEGLSTPRCCARLH